MTADDVHDSAVEGKSGDEIKSEAVSDATSQAVSQAVTQATDQIDIAEGTMSGAVALDSTGTQTISVSHGLDSAPAATNIDCPVILNPSQTDWAGFVMNVANIGSSSFDVVVNITSASGTGGATADLKWSITE